MVGLPTEIRQEFQALSHRTQSAPESEDDPTATEDAQAAMVEAFQLIGKAVAQAAEDPGDNVMGLLVTADIDDLQGGTFNLTQDQVATRVIELASAGHETVAKQVGNGVIALSWYPEQRAELAADFTLMSDAVEEMVRWDPSAHYVVRFVEEAVTLHDRTIPADSRVVFLTGSANHDERVFENPELFNINRKIDRHVGFAFGTHLCLGASLARLETRVAFEELLRRYPNYELGEPIVRYYGGNVRGLARLPLILDPAA